MDRIARSMFMARGMPARAAPAMLLFPFILLPRPDREGGEEGLGQVAGKLQIMICNRRG